MTATSEAKTDYTVVLRARSAARFMPEESWELNLNVPGLGLEGVRVRTFTRWVKEGNKELPRELVVEVRGSTGSLEEASAKFVVVARPVATMAGFVTNVQVGHLEVHLAYDSTPSHDERDFVETFLPDERGTVSEGRAIRRDLLETATLAFTALPEHSGRISRALRQYEMALRYWYLGGEWLALSHLWMAVEALTDAAIKHETSHLSITKADLAKSFDLALDDPDNPWQLALKHEARRRLIFRGDDDTYSTARKGRNGLEHGFMELDQVAQHALKCADKTFEYVRRMIIDLLGLPVDVTDHLMAIKPMDVQSLRKAIRGRLIGDAEDPAMEGELYPAIEWSSSIGSVVREDSTVRMTYDERFTLRSNPNIAFTPERLEVYGRLTDGKAPIEFTNENMEVKPAVDSVARRVLSAVMPLVDGASGMVEFQEHGLASMFAFNMFGQAVAYFRATVALIDAYLPVEALAPLRGLVVIAARFEQMTDPEGPGLGIAVRSVLDAITELEKNGADPGLVKTKSQEIQAQVESAGIMLPSTLEPPETTSIVHGLGAEMNMSASVANGTYGAIYLHTAEVSPDHAGFQVTLEHGPLADLVASAAVIAMLDTLSRAAQVFGWTVDNETIARITADARAVNETAATSNLRPTGEVFQAG